VEGDSELSQGMQHCGCCKRSGKTFGEVIDHFVVGYDKANMIANADGTVRIVGEFGCRKHEQNCIYTAKHHAPSNVLGQHQGIMGQRHSLYGWAMCISGF
jgi:hypothetical protein